MNDQLVLVVTEHRPFGWKINLYSAVYQSDDSIRILGLPNIKEEIEKGASNAVVALLKAADATSDESLLKAYSREKDKSKIAQSTIDNLIRPRIEKNCSEMLALASQTSIPIFFREIHGSRIIFTSNRLEILAESSRCLFNFIKDEKGLRYFITLTNADEEIVLQQEPSIVLSDDPCVVLLGKEIHRVDNIDSKKLVPFFTKTHIQVPAQSEKLYIQKFILKTIPQYDVRIEGIEMEEKHPEKTAVLVLEEDFYSRLVFSLFFQYDNQRLLPTTRQRKRRVVLLEEKNGMENIAWFDRSLEWENGLIKQLIEWGLTQEGENRFYFNQQLETLQRYGLIDWMNRNLERLKAFRIEQQTGKTYYQGTFRLESNVTEKIDWFEIEIMVIFEHFAIPFPRFRRHILTSNPEYVLPDGSIFILPEEWFQRYQELFLNSENTDKEIRVKKTLANFLNTAIESFFPKDRKKDLKQLMQKPVQRPIPSEYLNRILRPYQKEGFYWLEHLRKMRFGGCLADDMGLGKTIQTIALLESAYSQAGKKEKAKDSFGQLSLFDEIESLLPASLVVAPTSLLHNWQNELKRFAPDLKTCIYEGSKRKQSGNIHDFFNAYQVIITSYGIMRSDCDYLGNYSFYYLILDESQFIKNPDSIGYHAVKSLSSDHRLSLTGTPIENSLVDLWAQFNFINPDMLGTLLSFRKNYIDRIVRDKDKRTEAALLRMIQPFMLRRTKEEVTPELPPLTQEIVYCDMTEEQEKIYKSEKNGIRNKMMENKELFLKNNIIALQSLSRLRFLSNHPVLAIPDYTGDSGKFDQILLYFESIKTAGHKVLIFSSFVKYIHLFTNAFEERDWKYALLTGQTVNREEQIARFNDNPDINAFFISLKAGGTGLNLTAADYVFIVDPWWNPAAEMQALSRAHRIGQDKQVMVYRFISSDSIEEKIIALQNMKSRLSEVFVTSNNPLKQLNYHEIENLFE